MKMISIVSQRVTQRATRIVTQMVTSFVTGMVLAIGLACAQASPLPADDALLEAVDAGEGQAVAHAIFAGAELKPALLTTAVKAGSADVVAQLLRLGSNADVEAAMAVARSAQQNAGHAAVLEKLEVYLASQRAMRAQPPSAPATAISLAAGADLFTATRQAADGTTFVLAAGEYAGPIYVKGKRLTLLGDPDGKTTIVGSTQMKSAVVVADARATLTLARVGFKTSDDKQVAVLIRESKAVLISCSFEGLKNFAVYCQTGEVVISQCRFDQLHSAGVAGFKGAKLRVWQSDFTGMKAAALQLQDGSTLEVDGCSFNKMASSAIVGVRSGDIRVEASQFVDVGKIGVSVQQAGLVLLAHNDFSTCRRAANIDDAAELIVRNNAVKDSAQGDGFFIKPNGPATVRGNHFSAIQTAVNINGQSKTPTSLVANTAVAMTRGGFYLSKSHATIQNNRLLSFANVGILLDSQARATLTGNTVIADAGDAMAVSIQNDSAAQLAGNTLIGGKTAINFYKAKASDTSVHGDVLVGAILSGAEQPVLDDKSQRLMTLLGDEDKRASLQDVLSKWRGLAAAEREPELAQVMAHVAQLREQTTELAGVLLSVEDATGHRKAVGTRLYAAADVDFANVIAHASAGQLAIAQAGKYWVADAQDASVRRLITLAAGQDQHVTIRVKRGLWLRFAADMGAGRKSGQKADQAAEPLAEQWMLVHLREAGELRRALRMLRIDGLNTPHDVMLRPDATAQQINAARDGALAVLPELIRKPVDGTKLSGEQATAYWQEWRAKRRWVFRILDVVGRPADVDTLATLCLENDQVNTWRDVAPIAARIDARSGPLETGKLRQWLESDNKAQALAAAMALYELGDRAGASLMRRAILEQEALWMAYKPAFLLLDDDDPQTLVAMRKLHALCLVEDQQKQRSHFGGSNIAAALYLLAYGNTDDWQQVSRVLMGRNHASYFLMVAQDPQGLAKFMVDHTRGVDVYPEAVNRFLDRSQSEARFYRDQINRMEAMKSVASEKREIYRRRQYSLTLNAAQMVQVFDRPWKQAVGFLGGFERNRPIVIDGKAFEQLAQYMTWIIQPAYLDAYVEQWRAGRFGFAFQLDHIALNDTEAAVAKGDGPVPGWALFKLYRPVGTQQFLESFRNMSDGASHFPYVVKYLETTAEGKKRWGGGLSGVADVRADWRDDALRIAVRLRQDAFYNEIGTLAGTIGRNGNKARWPHHRYTLSHGRALIDKVVIRRGGKQFEARDTGVVEDGWLIFRAELADDALADLWLDVQLQFMDQQLLMTQSLGFGDQARRMREARDLADQWAAYAREDASHGRSLMSWGHAENAAGRVTRAKQAYLEALKLTPADERSWVDAAGMLAKPEDNTQAIALLNDGLKANPDSGYLAGEIARTHYRAGDYEAAAMAADRAMSLAPDDAGLRFTRATCLLLMGKHEAAEALFAGLGSDFSPGYVAMLRYIAARSSEVISDEAATGMLIKVGESDEAWQRTFSVLRGKARLADTLKAASDNAEACLLHTASGYQQLFAGKADGAREQFAAAWAMQRRDLLAWRLAEAELRRLGQGKETR